MSFTNNENNQGLKRSLNEIETLIPNELDSQNKTKKIRIETRDDQLTKVYNNGVYLLNQKKISQKNAFKLEFNDYLHEITQSSEIVGENFNAAGFVIDVGTTIFAARVDALHQNTIDFLNNFSSGSKSIQDVEKEDNEEISKQTSLRKIKKKSSYISSNIDSITLKESHNQLFQLDFYFSKISNSIENEGISGLLLNKLNKIENDSNQLLIVSDQHRFIESSICTNNKSFDKSDLVKSLSPNYCTNLKLCDGLNSFRFINWKHNESDLIDLTHDIETVASSSNGDISINSNEVNQPTNETETNDLIESDEQLALSNYDFENLNLKRLPQYLRKINSSNKTQKTMSSISKSTRKKQITPKHIKFFDRSDKSHIFTTKIKANTRSYRNEPKPQCLKSDFLLDFSLKNHFEYFCKQTQNILIHKTEIESPRTVLEDMVLDDEIGLSEHFKLVSPEKYSFEIASTNESNTIDIQSTAFNSENLILCPLIDIKYAKSSTNLDTKRLKAIIWDILTTNALLINDDSGYLSNSSFSNELKEENAVINISIRNLYQQLVPMITQLERENLSICILFQLVLYLANEHGLLLINNEDGSDLIIKKN